MRKAPANDVISGLPVTVLSVSPIAEDHTVLAAIFKRPERTPAGESKYVLRSCATIESAIAALSQGRISLVVTEQNLAKGSWRDLLENLSLLADPPYLIVTSRLADEYLWAEALNLGAYDVLAKPFDGSEVMRILDSASRHWTERHDELRVRKPQALAASTAA